jgi:hypothetical protein
LVGFTDFDWDGDVDDWKSIVGYVFTLGLGPITWTCKKQSSLALSLVEAECRATIQASKEVLMGVKIPRNKGRHCPFRKSQLDSRTFGMAGSMGLWTCYHSKCLVIVALKLKELKVSQLSNLI